jgi:predicted nucleic acid-binding protein
MAFQALQALDIECVLFPTPAEAYKLARTYRRSVYDSLYLAVAQSHQIDLWTGDRRLYNAVRRSLPFVKWIGDYESLDQP